MQRCESCGRQRLIDAVLRRWRVTGPGEAPAIVEEHPLCAECHAWLRGLFDEVRANRHGAPGIAGSPAHGDRALLFADQCYLCRELLDSAASIVDCHRPGSSTLAWGGFIVCAACDLWVASLAMDGRTARGMAERRIDGPYGDWPHPDCSRVTVTLALSNVAAREAVRAICGRMRVQVSGELPASNADALLLFEALDREAYPVWAWDAPVHWRGRIAFAPLARREALLRAVSAGATDWLTIPVTPQQVAGAMQRALRAWTRPVRIDRGTGLAVAYPDAEERPSLSVELEPGAERWETAWLLRRYTRGYDDLAVTADGRVLIFPRAPHEHLPAIAARLNRLLLGRCTVRPVARWEPAYRRLDAVG